MAVGFLEKLDDAINPIVVKELRQAVRSRFVVVALLLFLGLQVLILALFLIFSDVDRDMESFDYGIGQRVFFVLSIVLLTTCMLLVPLYAGVRLAGERSETNVDLLFVTALRPRSIIWGKFFSAIVLLLLIVSACAPFMTFTYLLRGIDIPTILVVLTIDLVAVMGSTQLAIFIAAIPAARVLKSLCGLITLGCLIGIYAMTWAGTYGLVQYGAGAALDSWEFWGPASCVLGVILTVIGLVFTWSVAVISPSSANRALPMRLLLLIAWVTTGIAFGLVSKEMSVAAPMYGWLVFSVALLNLQMIIAINEREKWAPRVARTIPRNWLLRVPAFLLYSGAAGGIFFAILLTVSTHLAVKIFLDRNPGFRTFGHDQEIAEAMTLVTLFVFCYCMTAVLIRRWLLASRVKPIHTWILAAVAMALCSSIPYLVAHLVRSNRYYYQHDYYLYLIANPFYAPFDEMHRETYQWFTGIWAGVVALLNIPWAMRQIARFRPFNPASTSAES
jgi:hypothetical protein